MYVCACMLEIELYDNYVEVHMHMWYIKNCLIVNDFSNTLYAFNSPEYNNFSMFDVFGWQNISPSLLEIKSAPIGAWK